jgi:hypothetical protein
LVTLVGIGASLYHIIHASQVVETVIISVQSNDNGKASVKYIVQNSEKKWIPYEGSFPFPEHVLGAQLARPERVWYHPSRPDVVLDYGKTWPIPYIHCMILAVLLPVLVAHLTALLIP